MSQGEEKTDRSAGYKCCLKKVGPSWVQASDSLGSGIDMDKFSQRAMVVTRGNDFCHGVWRQH